MTQPYGQIMEFYNARDNQIPHYRRNGKLQSCEPCRKSKLRCDHTLPSCGRCVKRRRVGQCVYHPAPLTQGRQTPPAALPTPSNSSLQSPPTVCASVEESTPAVEPLIPTTRQCEAPPAVPRAASAPLLDHRKNSTIRSNTGFLGSTSHSTIFAEDLGSLGVAVDLESGQMQSTCISNDRIARGCQVLSFLKERLMINRFIERWYHLSEGTGVILIEPILKGWCMSMWNHWKDVLACQKPEKIRKLSEQLFQNTQTPLQFDGSISAKHWIALGTGQNIRWEVIGCIAAVVGLCARTLDASDSLFKEYKVNREAMPNQMMEAASTCASFCRDCESLDDMFIWLLMEKYPLTGTIKGEGSYAGYQESGELNNAIVTKGLHANIQVDEKTPFFLAELRKRTFVQAYGSEVSIASFLGRPVRLSYRYCNINLPLDLDDDQIILEGAQLQAALASLDSDGWCRTGRVARTTWMRTWLGFAPRREDILDISLGSYTRDEVLQRAAEITKKSEQHWASLPSYLQTVRYERSRRENSAIESLNRNVIRQGTLANELLLQRVLMKKASVPPDKLIATARQIFKDIILITARHDIAKDYQMDLTYLLAAHGLRSAAIIAVELLKQEQLEVYPQRPRLPRSETIQDLSIFAARLGAVSPDEGSFGICDQGRKVITRILDKILSPPLTPLDRTIIAQQSGGAQMPTLRTDDDIAMEGLGPWPLDFGSGLGLEAPLNLGNDSEFMMWLENMDWGKQFSCPEFQ